MPSRRHHKPYIPRADGEFRDWLNNYAAVIAASTEAFFLPPQTGPMLIALAQRYEAAYLHRRTMKNAVATAAKNAVRKEAWSIVRPMAMLIKNNKAIAKRLKMELGVYPPHDAAGQSPIPAPRHAPLLNVLEMKPGVHRLRYQDARNPARFAKPPEATAMELCIWISKNADDASLMMQQSRAKRWRRNRSVANASTTSSRDSSPSAIGKEKLHIAARHVFNVCFDAEDRGKTATYRGRWLTERGLAGPWSKTVSVTIP